MVSQSVSPGPKLTPGTGPIYYLHGVSCFVFSSMWDFSRSICFARRLLIRSSLSQVCADCLTTDHRAVLYTQPLNEPGPHPLERLSVAEMSDVCGPLSDDVYDISPGLVSRVRYLYS